MPARRPFGLGVSIALLAMVGCSKSDSASTPGGGTPQQPSWTITASAGAGGSISPSGAVTVTEGASQTFTITPQAGGYTIAGVVVDGAPQGAIGTYTFTGVVANHTIGATFNAPVQPTSAVVRLATQGALPQGTLVGGIQATLTYATDKGLSIGAGNVGASGAGSGSLLVANANTVGQVIVALVNATGFGAGEFATATFGVAAPNVPAGTDFAIAPGAQVIDVNGAAIPGVTVGIGPPDLL
jgi:hypothetical protein